jgi:NAD(P)-dependent dehydrogenase (short-subunit alcohol dehydrogenase family)
VQKSSFLPEISLKPKSALAAMPGVIAEPLDLMDPVSIDAFANRFIGSGQALHILVNNAGIMVRLR